MTSLNEAPNCIRLGTRSALTGIVLAVAVTTSVCAQVTQKQPSDVTTASLPELMKLLRNPGTTTYQIEDILRALADRGPDAAPAADAILDRVALQAKYDDLINERDLAETPPVAVYALGKMGKGVVPTLIERLGNGDVLVRWVVISVLADLGPAAEPAIPALKAVILDDHFDPKRALMIEDDAASVIAHLGAAGLPALTELSTNKRPEIRSLTLFSLIGYSGPKDDVIPLLLVGLGDGESFVRQRAIHVIERMKLQRPQIRAALREVAEKDPDPSTRELASRVVNVLDRGASIRDDPQ